MGTLTIITLALSGALASGLGLLPREGRHAGRQSEREPCVYQYTSSRHAAPADMFENYQLISSAFDEALLKSSSCYVRVLDGSSSTQKNLDNVAKEMTNVRVRRKALIVDQDGSNEESVREILKISLNFVVKLAVFNSTNETENPLQHKKFLELAMTVFPPFAMPRGASYYGVDFDIWKVILEKVNIPTKFIMGNNMVHTLTLVKQGQADASIMSLIIIKNWFSGVDLVPITRTRDIPLYSRMPPRRSQFETLVQPFNWPVWVCVTVSVACICLAVLVVVAVDGHGYTRDTFLLCTVGYAIMISESLPHQLISIQESRPLNILLFLWIPLTCLIGMAYQSNLRAALIKVDYENPINSFEDVLSRDMVFHVPRGTLTNLMMSTSPIPRVKQFYEKSHVMYDFTPSGRPPDWMYEEVEAGKAIVDSIPVRMVGMRHLYHRLRDDMVGSFHCCYYFGMNHPAVDTIQEVIARMVEGGITGHIMDRVLWVMAYPEREYERNKEGRGAESLKFGHLAPLFVTTGALLSCALMIWAGEFLQKVTFRFMSRPRHIRFHI